MRERDVRTEPFRRRDYRLRLRLRLPSTRAALRRAVRDVLRFARRCQCPPRVEPNLEIALREALANAIAHGNAYGRGKRVFLRCYGRPGEALVVLVRDEGRGFDPEQVPDPREEARIELEHGRGLLLMRALMDCVEFRKGGREVLLYKSCTIEADASAPSPGQSSSR